MWWQRLAAALGLWLMAAPALLGLSGTAGDLLHVLGPIAVAIGWTASSEVLRGVRWLNLPVGVTLVIAPFLFAFPSVALVATALTGIALAALSALGGETSTRFGGGWRALLR